MFDRKYEEAEKRLVMNKIGIVVPVYNVEGHLERCIDSFIRQTYRNYHMILVDDGSQDRSGEICDQYSKNYTNIDVIHKSNGGAASARNLGIDYLLTRHDIEWITFVDSDDWVSEEYLRILLSAVNESKTFMAIANIKHLTPGEECNAEVGRTAYENIVMSPEEAFISSNVNTIAACAKIYSIRLFESVRFPNGKIHEDRHTIYKVMFHCDKIAVVPVPIYMYYYNPNSVIHSSWTLKFSMDNIEAVENQLDFFADKGYRKAWECASRQYMDLLIVSMREMRRHGSEYRKDRGNLNKKMKLFVLKFHNELNWPVSRIFFALSYPVLEPIYKLNHKE